MADQNFMDLASKTASGITGTDYMMLVNNSEAYKALVNDVAEAILGKLTSKSFSGLETTAKNVIGALNELNSKSIKSASDKRYIRITTQKSSYNYGTVLLVTNNCMMAFLISGSSGHTVIFNSNQESNIVITHPSNTITDIDLNNPYAHTVIMFGGNLSIFANVQVSTQPFS